VHSPCAIRLALARPLTALRVIISDGGAIGAQAQFQMSARWPRLAVQGSETLRDRPAALPTLEMCDLGTPWTGTPTRPLAKAYFSAGKAFSGSPR